MNTLDKLQALLASEIQYIGGYPYKAPIKSVQCVDGTSASIQASETHYSTPRNNFGPYTEVEVWCIRGDNVGDITECEYEASDPSGYVPIEQVVQFLDNHGGIKE